MKKITQILLILFYLTNYGISQNVGIGTITPQAKLDVTSTESGIIIPRIALTSTSVMAPVINADESEMVYNTNTVADVTPGFYYWDSAKWVRMDSQPDKDWNKLDDTTPTDINDDIYTNGNVGINTNAPVVDLHVNGGGAKLRVGPVFATNDRDFVEIQADGADTKIVSPNERFHIENTAGDIVLNPTDNVGIDNTTPSNKLDVNGYLEIGNEVIGGANVEGAMRYNTDSKCVQFYDGTTWRCIGEPKLQNFYLRDGINEGADGGGANLQNWQTVGYGAQVPFTVNGCRKNGRILFLVEVTLGTGDKRSNNAYNCAIKIYGNGVWHEKHVPAVGNDENYTVFFWGTPNASGNLSFTFESNIHYADLKLTTVVF